jgi:hypothetical protein
VQNAPVTVDFAQAEKPDVGDRIVALIEYRDGTIIDIVKQLLPKDHSTRGANAVYFN